MSRKILYQLFTVKAGVQLTHEMQLTNALRGSMLVQAHAHVSGRDGVMFMYDVALCGNTVRNGLLVSDWLATPAVWHRILTC